MGDQVTTIGWSAFEDCKSLRSLRLSSALRSIETQAFAGCSALTSVDLPAGLTSFGEGAVSDKSSHVQSPATGIP